MNSVRKRLVMFLISFFKSHETTKPSNELIVLTGTVCVAKA